MLLSCFREKMSACGGAIALMGIWRPPRIAQKEVPFLGGLIQLSSLELAQTCGDVLTCKFNINRREWIQLKGCVFSRLAPARGMEARKCNPSIASLPTAFLPFRTPMVDTKLNSLFGTISVVTITEQDCTIWEAKSVSDHHETGAYLRPRAYLHHAPLYS